MAFWSSLFRRKSDNFARYMFDGYGNRSTSGRSVTSETAMQCVTVASCVRVLAESCAQLPLSLYFKDASGNRKEATKHRLTKLLNVQPNEWQTAYEFREMLTGHVALTGNAFAYKVLVDGEVRELIPLHPSTVSVRQDDGYRLRYTVTNESNRIVGEFDQTQIFHLRGLSSNGIVGFSPISMHREAIGLSLASEEHGGRVMSNGARIGGFLTHPKKLGEGGPKALREQFEEAFAGLNNVGRTPVLEEGMSFHPVQMSAADLQLLEQRKYQRSEIASIFRIPPHMIGDLEHATFSNIEHQAIQFVSYGLLPWLRRWEATIARDLIPENQQSYMYARHNVDGLLRGDIKSRYDAYAVARQWGWMSADDIRALEDLNPLPDQRGTEYLTPMNMIPAGERPDPDPSLQQDEPNAE